MFSGRKRAAGLIIGAWLAITAPVAAQPAAEAPAGNGAARSDSPNADAAQDQDTPNASDSASAERILDELLQRRSEDPLIDPARPDDQSSATRSDPAAAPPASLRREGTFIVSRSARMAPVSRGSSAWMILFDATPDQPQPPPMYLMPCRILEDMEAIHRDRGDDPVRFTVSGQVFVYRGANYLLPTLMSPAPQRDEPPQESQEQADPPDRDQPSEQDADEQQRSAEEVLEELLRRRSERDGTTGPASADAPGDRRPSAPAPVSPASSGDVSGTAPGAAERLMREGSFIITRRARMVPVGQDSSAWMILFESDTGADGAPPMYLMPCRMLEDMEAIVRDQGDAAKFIVSGEVFVYRGTNYFLPTLMKLAPDRGNLSP